MYSNLDDLYVRDESDAGTVNAAIFTYEFRSNGFVEYANTELGLEELYNISLSEYVYMDVMLSKSEDNDKVVHVGDDVNILEV